MVKYYIAHSAKGSTWKKHKYIKIMNGLYFYPDDYVGGRHISSTKKTTSKKSSDKSSEKKDTKKSSSSEKDKDEKKKGISSKRVEKLANKVIRGDYGVGQDRMNKLGKKYYKVQNRVNQILLGDAGAKRVWKNTLKPQKQAARSSAKKTISTKKKTSTRKKTTSKK